MVEEEQEPRLADLLRNYSNRRIIQIISNGIKDEFELKDMLFMYNSIQKYCIANLIDMRLFLDKDAKSFKDIHNHLQRSLRKIGRENIPIHLEMPSFILELDRKTFEDFEVQLPKKNSDLIEAGQFLSNCVGNDFYANEMARGRIAIFILYRKNKAEYCIEYDIRLNQICQGKAYANVDMNRELRERIIKFLSEHRPTRL